MESDDVVTLWVRLKGEERERAAFMRTREKRSYASLLRMALDAYYQANYVNNVLADVDIEY